MLLLSKILTKNIISNKKWFTPKNSFSLSLYSKLNYLNSEQYLTKSKGSYLLVASKHCSKYVINLSVPTLNYSCIQKCDLLGPVQKNGLLNKISLKTYVFLFSIRLKSKKKKTTFDRDESSSDEEDEGEVFLESGINFREIKVRVESLRMDTILKAGLGISRNKVDELFYGSKLRVNKEKIKKKSISLQEGDFVDVIKSTDTSADMVHFEISRIVLKKFLTFDEDSGKVYVILRKYPKLLLKSYNDDIKV